MRASESSAGNSQHCPEQRYSNATQSTRKGGAPSTMDMPVDGSSALPGMQGPGDHSRVPRAQIKDQKGLDIMAPCVCACLGFFSAPS